MRTCDRCPRQIQPQNGTGTCFNCRRLLARTAAPPDHPRQAGILFRAQMVERYAAIVENGGRLFEEADQAQGSA